MTTLHNTLIFTEMAFSHCQNRWQKVLSHGYLRQV